MSTLVWLSFGALWVLVLFQGLVLLGLVKTVYTLGGVHVHGREEDDSDDLLHQRAPGFRALDLAGTTFNSSDITGEPRALLFVSPRCRSCSVTPDELESLTWKAGGRVYVVCRGGARECEEFAALHELGTSVLVDDSFEISRAFKVTGVPTAVLIDESNIVQSYGNPMREDELIEILDEELQPAAEEVK